VHNTPTEQIFKGSPVEDSDCPQQLLYKIEKGACLIKANAPMHESQSTACVRFIYSLVTTGLKKKKKKDKEVPFK